MNKTALIIITLGLIVFLGIIFSDDPKTKSVGQTIPNVEIRDGVQYVTITAKGGYIPKVSSAKADIPTKLLVNTKDTFDCSASMVIPALNYQKLLAQNSETESRYRHTQNRRKVARTLFYGNV
jgi:plastocyanin domain-containing protein